LRDFHDRAYEGIRALKFHVVHDGIGSAGAAVTTVAANTGLEPTSQAESAAAGKDLSGYSTVRLYVRCPDRRE
jgi:NaMN:DMB phosphoribosyltransferase